MIGSTILHCPDRALLLHPDIDDLLALPEVATLELDRLTSLDFAIAEQSTGEAWNEPGEPVRLEEENGLVIMAIRPAGIRAYLAWDRAVEDAEVEDLEALRQFVAAHGTEDLYELVTF